MWIIRIMLQNWLCEPYTISSHLDETEYGFQWYDIMWRGVFIIVSYLSKKPVEKGDAGPLSVEVDKRIQCPGTICVLFYVILFLNNIIKVTSARIY